MIKLTKAQRREPITVCFTREELFELDCLLANGVCDYEHPSNKVAQSAYSKIGAALIARRSTLNSPVPHD